MENFKKKLPSYLFAITETLIIFIIGILLEIEYKQIVLIMLAFAISKLSIVKFKFGKAMHYKSIYKCVIWSSLVLLSLFILSKASIELSVIMTIFTAITISSICNVKDNKVDISDIYMWGGNKLNLQVYDWVKYNQDNKKLLEYEKNLKETDKRKYYIFVYRFKEFKSYKDIAELMELDEQRICDEIKIMSHFIEYSIRLNEGE